MEALFKKFNYPSASRFYQILKDNGITQSHSQVKAFVDKHAISQVHKPVQQITASVINESWQVDLLDYYKYSYKNRGFHFLMFSIKEYLERCKSKSPVDTVKAFKNMTAKLKPQKGIYCCIQPNELAGRNSYF